MKTTLAILALNEIEGIQVVVPKINPAWVDEIIVVDGGSTDGTIEWCEAHNLRVLRQRRRGYGAGMREVIEIAAGDVVIEFMADGNCDPAAIPKLVSRIAEGYDLVIGSRYVDGATSLDDTWMTRFGNWCFTRVINVLFGASFSDAMMGFRAYRIAAFKTMEIDEDGLTFPTQGSIEFTKYGYRVAEVGASEPKRIGGVRKAHNFYTGLALLRMIAKEYFRPIRRMPVADGCPKQDPVDGRSSPRDQKPGRLATARE
jgi:glycosyltransferase involved in cell wall biosynthesis